MANPRTDTFLDWIAQRLVNVYSESVHTDFVKRLEAEAARAHTLLSNLSMNTRTYYLVDTCGDRHDDDEPRICSYALVAHSTGELISSELRLTQQQATDLSRQLDAPVDYFND